MCIHENTQKLTKTCNVSSLTQKGTQSSAQESMFNTLLLYLKK